ncbi:MAG TPA: asparagine synthase (glutamine-hydrolyzing), partial [Thermoanaerobaculia bacterium]|nr:asparagine synthase (glutamine-hydrolyzing) [Thermoanaerobaculia bacterium]
MCGIAGIVHFNPEDGVDVERLRRMRDVLRHRGPDGEGLWSDHRVGLAHRRLAIVDIAGGAQPMSNSDRTVWITFNGEIYNHPELKRELEAKGYRYRSRSDTETILHIYEDLGEAGVARLRGMFAIALWDGARQRLLLARDRLGIKPLYYAVTRKGILFASEIKAILAAAVIRPELNVSIIPEYLATGFVSGEQTFFAGIRKLLPGRTLTWSASEGLRERRYWQLPAPGQESRSVAEEACRVRDHLRDAVRSHLMSDVPVGLFLSGGIDSAGLGAIMASLVREPVKTFSVAFNEREGNELPYARLAARAMGADHHEVIVSGSEFFRALPRLTWHEDEPVAFPASVPLFFVSALARQHVKVVLTGEGADELFWGYNRYRVAHWNHRLGRVYNRILPRFARSTAHRAIERLSPRAGRYLRRSFLNYDVDSRSMFFENFSIFGHGALEQLLSNPLLLHARDRFTDLLEHYQATGGSLLDRITHTDLQTYLVELLMKQDQMSMATSVESRVPYLDHPLVEYVVALPPNNKIHGWQTKRVLREALRGLIPPQILTRRKKGFPVPVSSWLRAPFRSVVDELVTGSRASERGLFEKNFVLRLAREHTSGFADHGMRLWLLANLEIWHRVFID